MSKTVKSFSVGVSPINNSDAFSSGDRLTGRITLELAGDCKINSLCVKLKGKAQVKWTETYGKVRVTYRDKEKYFSITQFLIKGQPTHDSQTVARGCHVYPFTFQIPAHNLPPSFKGTAGKIQYTLEAILCRPMRPNSKAKAPFTLISKTNVNSSSELWEQTPQHDIKEKKMNFFTSGSVSMDVHIDRTAFYEGEGIKVMASILNSSSREIRPKYCVYRKHSFFAENKRKVNTEDLIKEVGEPIPPSSSQTVTRIITIPPSLGVSILNCKLIKAEYRLRVYLDVKYARDPVIKFPIVILPAPQEPDVEQRPAYGGFGFEAFGNPSQ